MNSKLLRITTVPMSLQLLLTGQMRYMQQKGLEVIMASADGPELEAVKEAESCPHLMIPFTRAITPLQDLKCLWLLIKWMWQEKPDIVHTHTPKAGLLGMLAAKLTGVPVRIHTIAGLPFMTATGNRRRLLEWMEKLTYWGAQHVWPNSKSMLAYVRESRLCPERKLSIISEGSTNGIDLSVFSPEALDSTILEDIKKTFQDEAESTYILAIGRVVRDKGIPELVDAFTELQAAFPELKLLLIGPMEEERQEEILPQATLQKIRQNPAIQHIQWTNQVAYYLHLADVLVHASHREGFPNVPSQAGAMRCPIVCSNIPGNIDIVTNEETGLIFRVGDRNHLIEQLRTALTNQDHGQEMAENLRQKIEQFFAREIIQEELYRRYQELLSQGK